MEVNPTTVISGNGLAPIKALPVTCHVSNDEAEIQENNLHKESKSSSLAVASSSTKTLFPEAKTKLKIPTSKEEKNQSCIEENILNGNKTYQTIIGLKLRKDYLLQEISMIDDQLKDMQELKQIVNRFSSKLKAFSTAILQLDRNRQGVPYVANVKALFQNINQELTGESIRYYIGKLNTQDVPFVIELNVQLSNLNQICENIIVHHVHYHVTYLENFHLVVGKLCGMMKAIAVLYYADDVKSNELLDQSFDDLVIDESGDKEDDSDEENLKESSQELLSTTPRQTPYSLQYEEIMSPRQTNSSWYNEFNTSRQLSARTNDSVKYLTCLRKQIQEANQILGSIHRLSLGNPKIQSLRDYFAMAGDVLSKVNLTFLKANNVPFANKIEAGVVKMIRLSSLKRPSECHVEKMKLFLGDVDGRVYILIKNLST